MRPGLRSGYLIPVETPQEMQCVCLALLVFMDHNGMSICDAEMTEHAEQILRDELERMGGEKSSALALRMSQLLEAALLAEGAGLDLQTIAKHVKSKREEAAQN